MFVGDYLLSGLIPSNSLVEHYLYLFGTREWMVDTFSFRTGDTHNYYYVAQVATHN